jgi:hypothetical protein
MKLACTSYCKAVRKIDKERRLAGTRENNTDSEIHDEKSHLTHLV